jgi:hypothetical protein
MALSGFENYLSAINRNIIYMEDNENWLKIDSFEKYEVSNLGRVKNMKTCIILKTCISHGNVMVRPII